MWLTKRRNSDTVHETTRTQKSNRNKRTINVISESYRLAVNLANLCPLAILSRVYARLPGESNEKLYFQGLARRIGLDRLTLFEAIQCAILNKSKDLQVRQAHSEILLNWGSSHNGGSECNEEACSYLSQ